MSAIKDKNGVEIKDGDTILSKGKWKYLIFVNQNYGGLWANGKNLHHTGKLENFDLTKVEVIR